MAARAKLFEVKADLEIIMRHHMDSRTSPDHFAVRFANATSPSRGTLALSATPPHGPDPARVTLFGIGRIQPAEVASPRRLGNLCAIWAKSVLFA